MRHNPPGHRTGLSRHGQEAMVIPIESENLGSRVYRAVKGMIISGELRSGEKLGQEELASKLGVSRTPLLFALTKLEQEKLIETLPRRGASVCRYSHKDLLDIYDIRCRLEPLAARDAVANATTEDIDILARLLDDFDVAAQGGNSQAVKAADYEFHMELMRASGNRFLSDMLSTANIIIIGNTKGLLKPAMVSSVEHRQLLAALRERDAARAERIMFEHVDGARAKLASSDTYLLDPAEP